MDKFISIELKCDAPVFSVIICSIDEEKYKCCRDNIAATIGMPVEFIRIKNREAKYSIAKAYNRGASVATAPNLLFIHEDVLFENYGWGVKMSEKLAEPTTGVIGFIGVPFRLGAYSGWCEHGYYAVGHMFYIQDGSRIGWHKEPWHKNWDKGGDFAQVIVVDGLGFAVRRDIWILKPFDETILDGFHCYDIDFCLQIGTSYSNYVYLKADITHFSNGNMDCRWIEQTIKMTEEKWSKMLPMCVSGLEPDKPKRIIARADYDFALKAIRGRATRQQAGYILWCFIKKAVKSKYYRKYVVTLLYQFAIKYRTLSSSKQCLYF